MSIAKKDPVIMGRLGGCKSLTLDLSPKAIPEIQS